MVVDTNSEQLLMISLTAIIWPIPWTTNIKWVTSQGRSSVHAGSLYPRFNFVPAVRGLIWHIWGWCEGCLWGGVWGLGGGVFEGMVVCDWCVWASVGVSDGVWSCGSKLGYVRLLDGVKIYEGRWRYMALWISVYYWFCEKEKVFSMSSHNLKLLQIIVLFDTLQCNSIRF